MSTKQFRICGERGGFTCKNNCLFFIVVPILILISFFSYLYALGYDFDGDQDVDGKDLAEWIYHGQYELNLLANEFGDKLTSDYYVKLTGIRTSGPSIPDDWSDANCYSNIDKALNQLAGDGERVIIDDGDYTISTYDFNNRNQNSFKGTVTLTSRSLDPSAVSITTTGIHKFFLFNKDNVTLNPEYITFKNQDNASSANAPFLINAMAPGSNPTWKNVIIDNINRTVEGAINKNAMIYASGIEGTVVLDNVEVKNCDISCSYAAWNGTLISSDDSDVNWCFKNVHFHDNTFTHNSGTTYATIYCKGNMTLEGDNVFEDISINPTGQIFSGFLRVGGDVTVANGTTILFDNINLAGEGATLNGWIWRNEGSAIISGLTIRNCTQSGLANNDVGCIVAYGTGAAMTLIAPHIHDNYGDFEGMASSSQGGSLHLIRADIHDNRVKVGAFRFGGWNTDQSAQYCKIIRNHARSNEVNGGPGGEIHIHGTAITDQVAVIANCLFAWNTAENSDSACLFVDNAGGNGNQLNLTAHNNIFYNPDLEKEIFVAETGGAGKVTATFDYNCIYGGQADTIGIDTYGGNNIPDDPLLTAKGEATFTGCIGTGAIIAGIHDQDTPAEDIEGIPVVLPPNMGCYDGQTD